MIDWCMPFEVVWCVQCYEWGRLQQGGHETR